ncbi:MAG: hypothetical protein Q9198_005754 [Flavoplaca austrocitrina]
MDTTASIITIFRLALQIKKLVEEVRQYDENAQKLSERLDTFRTIVQHAGTQYGQEEESKHTISEQQMRQAIRTILSRCAGDLRKFKKRLAVLVSRGNWASRAWTQQTAAPDLARIDKSLSDHQRDIESLSSLLLELVPIVLLFQYEKDPNISIRIRTGQMRDTQKQILDLLRRLTNTPSDNLSPSISSGDTDANTNSLISQLTTLVGGPDPIAGQEEGGDDETTETLGVEQETTGHPGSEYNHNGALLLGAIHDGNQKDFSSLLQDDKTSLRVVDEQDQTPLLLAAHLGNKDMVEAIMACDNPPSADNPNEPADHRRIDYKATDSLGRTALHYCAEFGMHDEAITLLDHGVDINALDKLDHPPMYYAIKFRQYDAVKLLLAKGATRHSEWPLESTSHQIKMLLEEGSGSGESTTASASNFDSILHGWRLQSPHSLLR